MPSRGKILTLNSTTLSTPLGSFGSKDEYVCTNAQITQGITSTPNSLDDCLKRFPGISFIADAIGVTSQSSLFSFPGNCFGPTGLTYPIDLYLIEPSNECEYIKTNPNLGPEFYGCLWGLPEAPFNCSCPDLGDKFEAYIKLRLNNATFWNTPKTAPIKRREFLDSLKYARKITINIAGDISIRPGNIVEIRANGISGYPYSIGESVLNGMYWVLGVKHVFNNSGTHETSLTLSDILKPNSASTVPGTGQNNTNQSWNSSLNIPNSPGDFRDPFMPPPGFEGYWI
jgi:hypothetical protein